jgi:hypothetical protein
LYFSCKMWAVYVQVLLVASAGSMARTLPILAVAYYGILFAWTRSVDKLSQLHVCAFTAEEESEDSELDLEAPSESIDVNAVIKPSSPSSMT